jgi:hypothetical protein
MTADVLLSLVHISLVLIDSQRIALNLFGQVMLHCSNEGCDITKQSSLRCLVFCVLLNITTRPLKFSQGAATAAAKKHNKTQPRPSGRGWGLPAAGRPGGALNNGRNTA